MKKIAVVSAMPIEVNYIHEYLKEKEDWEKVSEDTYLNPKKQVTLTAQVMGVGKVNAAYKTTEIIYQLHPDLIVNIGYAGAMVDQAKRGDVAIGTEYVQVDFIPFLDENITPISKSPQKLVSKLETVAEKLGFTYYTGKISTGDFFLQSLEKKQEIQRIYHPIAFDMETAAVAQVATIKEIDFLGLRTFSDMADEDAIDSIGNTSDQIEHKPIILLLETIEQF